MIDACTLTLFSKKKMDAPKAGDMGRSEKEFQVAEPALYDLRLPPPTANSSEVRDYLTSLLKNKHKLSDDHAHRIAARWTTIGTGRELRNYKAQKYLSVFGQDDGWVLYSDIKLEVYREAWKEKSFLQKHWICL